jgi:polyisoprenyl-phosphate glycosyltransferase
VTLVSVVVPVYNNVASLPELLRRLRVVAGRLNSLKFEFLFVDDGSADDSFGLLQQEGEADQRVRALRLSRNFGSNPAILAGLTHARGDCVVVLAADLQDPPELIPEMLECWEAGGEVVLAARRSRDDPWLGKLFARAFNWLFKKVAFPDFPTEGFDFVLVSCRVATILAELAERNSYIFGQIMWVGFERRVVYYHRAERQHGRSGWTVLKKVKYFIDAFTAFSYLPIRAASLVGFVIALAGVGYAALIAALRLFVGISETGFAALMVTILVVSGVQLIIIGMIGEYLWRVLEESRRRPPFIVAATVNVGPTPSDPSEHPRSATIIGSAGHESTGTYGRMGSCETRPHESSSLQASADPLPCRADPH